MHEDGPLEESQKKKNYVKKTLNAFMLFMKEERQKVVKECTLKESVAINQILGRKVSRKTYWKQCLQYFSVVFFTQERHFFASVYTVKGADAVTCIKRSHFSCPDIENFIWIEPFVRGHLSYKATFSWSEKWPLNTGLTLVVYHNNGPILIEKSVVYGIKATCFCSWFVYVYYFKHYANITNK